MPSGISYTSIQHCKIYDLDIFALGTLKFIFSNIYFLASSSPTSLNCIKITQDHLKN